MATTTATNNMLSTSTSSFRTSQTQPNPNTLSYADNPITHLPTVDFNFEDLRKRMADFTSKFDQFIERGRKRVLSERNSFRAHLGEIHEEQRSTTTQITTLQCTLSSHTTLLSREATEKTEMHAQITSLQTHSARQQAHRDSLRNAIAHTQRQIEAKEAAQREYAEKIDGQARLNGPELAFWESCLGCRIEGAGDESLVRVVFVFAPVKGGKEREAVFELMVPESGSAGYSVVHCRPGLEEGRVAEVVRRLNETRDVRALLKGMRELFAAEMK